MAKIFIENGNHSLQGVEEIVISTEEGDVNIVHTPNFEVSWEAYWHEESEHAQIVQEGNRLLIRFYDKSNFFDAFGLKITKRGIGHWASSLDKVTVSIPVGFANLTINTISGDVKTDTMDLSGCFQVNSISGDIHGQNLHTKVCKIITKSGDCNVQESMTEELKIDTLSGDFRFSECGCEKAFTRSKSGDITIGFKGDSLKEIAIENISGDVEIVNAPCRVRMASVSGDIVLQSELTKNIDWNFKTVSGDIDVDVPTSNVTINFSSISGEVGFKNIKPQYSSKNSFVIGNGEDGRIVVHSISGDLTFKALPDKIGIPAQEKEVKVEEENPKKTIARKFILPDENVLKVVQMQRQGVITREEAVDILKTMEYKEEEIQIFLREEEDQNSV